MGHSLFRRPHHQRIEAVLRALDPNVLAEHQCWFGGGTAIALRNDEFRESVDIDFLVSDQAAYRRLRQLVRDRGFDGLATTRLEVGRQPTIDTYGIRGSVLEDGVPIKFEIVHEGRIELDQPDTSDEICGVRTLTVVDQVATKLLANDDRWPDTSVFSRDLIDLAMMKASTQALTSGARKAVDAYGSSVGEALRKAVDQFRERPQRLDRCLEALQIELPRASVWQAIRDFEARCAKVGVLQE